VGRQEHAIDKVLDRRLITEARPALEWRERVRITAPIRNTDRATGTMLASEVARLFGAEGLPDDTIAVDLTGTAGQSFGAFLARGITLTLEGEANDYVGKGLSGGRLVIFPPRNAAYRDGANTIAGNVALYGATGGEAFIRGSAGERFAIRNSGARAVVEGVGFHGCEYMTGGTVVILGPTGLNFAAGMSGGLAYVLDVDGEFDQRCNLDMVDLDLLDDRDEETVQALIRTHVDLTGSTLGAEVLAGWKDFRARFIKVFPMEYRKVLGRMIKDDAETRREVPQHG